MTSEELVEFARAEAGKLMPNMEQHKVTFCLVVVDIPGWPADHRPNLVTVGDIALATRIASVLRGDIERLVGQEFKLETRYPEGGPNGGN